jgi:lambda family phage portal protein
MTAHRGAAYDDPALMGWHAPILSPDAALLPELDELRARSQDLGRNSLLGATIQTHKDNIVGAVLRLSVQPDERLLGWEHDRAREWGNTVEAHFRSWSDTTDCDAARTSNLLGLTVQALGGTALNGDAIALPLWLPRGDSPWATRLMLLESERLSTPPALSHRADIRAGIEQDRYGAPVAYHLARRHPGEHLLGLYGGILEWDRIPAFTPWGRRRVLHLHDKDRTGQSRGKPLVAAVMKEFHMADQYASNELAASVANSLVAAFLESDLDQESAARLFGEDPREAWKQSLGEARSSMSRLKGAAVIPLPAGAKMNSLSPGRPNPAFEAFMVNSERRIAASLGLPYELFLKDFSKTNYSSARAALLEAWRYFHGRRRWLTDTWLRPIFELWLEEAVNAGTVEAPDFYRLRYAYCRCRFVFGGRGWVDPVKEAQAAVLRMNAGLSTLEAECAEQGLDYEDVIRQRQTEREMLDAAGLSNPTVDARKPSGLFVQEDVAETDEADDETDTEEQAA